MTAEVAALDGGVYLGAYLAPFREWLSRDTVTEILVNRPGEVWIEEAGAGMRREEAPDIDDRLIERLASQAARITHQAVSREHPLLAATLPDGSRTQFVGPPATRRGWAVAIRRHRAVDVALDDWARAASSGSSLADLCPEEAERDPVAFLRRAVAARATILISGGTSSGKTTFLNGLLREISPSDRVILVEDTPEIRSPGPNSLGLVAVRGETGEAMVDADDLLKAALRLRPDRIVLGELRGAEAVSFLRAVNTGHPGSFSTIHANTPSGALEQLALMVMQADLGLSRPDTLEYARSVIDVVVQLHRPNGRRAIAAVELTRSR